MDRDVIDFRTANIKTRRLGLPDRRRIRVTIVPFADPPCVSVFRFSYRDGARSARLYGPAALAMAEAFIAGLTNVPPLVPEWRVGRPRRAA